MAKIISKKANVETKSAIIAQTIPSKRRRFKADNNHTSLLIKAGKTAAANAIRENKALGLSITYIKDGALYKEWPDGKIDKLKILPVLNQSGKFERKLKKGMILHAIK